MFASVLYLGTRIFFSKGQPIQILIYKQPKIDQNQTKSLSKSLKHSIQNLKTQQQDIFLCILIIYLLKTNSPAYYNGEPNKQHYFIRFEYQYGN